MHPAGVYTPGKGRIKWKASDRPAATCKQAGQHLLQALERCAPGLQALSLHSGGSYNWAADSAEKAKAVLAQCTQLRHLRMSDWRGRVAALVFGHAAHTSLATLRVLGSGRDVADAAGPKLPATLRELDVEIGKVPEWLTRLTGLQHLSLRHSGESDRALRATPLSAL